ncbi:amino acid/amide ABC transporter membrane protein 2, HAAT family [Bosea sp. OK403]|uniref:branched-chain amino acid ABC transporter permease n=1 Tax=Bosea sp. OK403 TaxID=1855286 RepID=UPI0008EB5013|nr:branched-chain amino acid ABC transporter permease [Bosea sp. OK403]SFI45334.1 amino acid/amide ABC transporter membrane protein 2, HAAT family [Bosea sp. OK403]
MRSLPALLILAVAIAVPIAFGGNSYVMGLMVSALIVAGVALAWALLGNLGGMVSFGHAAFFGVGAYTSAILSAKFGLPVPLALLAGACGAALCSVAMLPALRLSGPYFALAILAYAHIFKILATEATSITGGSAGFQRFPPLPTIMGLDLSSRIGSYCLLVVLVALCAAIYLAVKRSHVGTALRAMAESEDATRVVGVNATLLKAWMLLLSAFITGLFGAMNAHIINFLEPDYAFSASWSILPIIAAIFGGYRTILGPVAGAALIYLFDQIIAKELLPVGHEILLGVLLAGMILIAPNGLFGMFQRKTTKGAAHAAA